MESSPDEFEPTHLSINVTPHGWCGVLWAGQQFHMLSFPVHTQCKLKSERMLPFPLSPVAQLSQWSCCKYVTQPHLQERGKSQPQPSLSYTLQIPGIDEVSSHSKQERCVVIHGQTAGNCTL